MISVTLDSDRFENCIWYDSRDDICDCKAFIILPTAYGASDTKKFDSLEERQVVIVKMWWVRFPFIRSL